MSILDVLVLPSIQNEDFPNMILEAMALGKPVICYQSETLLEFYYEVGLLADKSTPMINAKSYTIKDAILFCIENKD